MHSDGRTTLIVEDNPATRWIETGHRPTMFADSLEEASFSLRAMALDSGTDIGRVIVDHAASAVDSLRFIASLPHYFIGDVLFILDENDAFLSASGRTGDRVLYALSPSDVSFYLSANGLQREEAPATVRLTA